jgi:hypothetical protein
VALQDISPAARKLNLNGQLLIDAKVDVTGKVYFRTGALRMSMAQFEQAGT